MRPRRRGARPPSQGGDRGFESRTGHLILNSESRQMFYSPRGEGADLTNNLTNTPRLTNADGAAAAVQQRPKKGQGTLYRRSDRRWFAKVTWGGRQHYLASGNDRAAASAALAAWLASPYEPQRANRFRAPAPENAADCSKFCKKGEHWACHGVRGRGRSKNVCECQCHGHWLL